MEYLSVDDDIHLEKLRKAHADEVFRIIDRDRAYLRKWLPFVDQTRQVKDTQAFIDSLCSVVNRDKNAIYLVWYRGEPAGLAGFKDIDPVNHRTEIGYWLAEHLQGKGIITRSAGKLLDFGFRNLKMNRIQIKVAEGNLKSIAIPHRLGMVCEGVERAGEFHTDRYHDLEVFSMLKSEWVERLLNP